MLQRHNAPHQDAEAIRARRLRHKARLARLEAERLDAEATIAEQQVRIRNLIAEQEQARREIQAERDELAARELTIVSNVLLSGRCQR